MTLHVLLMTAAMVLTAADPKSDPKADPKSDAAKAELEKFQGTWTVVSLEEDGRKQPEEQTRKLKFIFKGDRLIINEDKDNEEFVFRIDAAAAPKAMDIRSADGKQLILAVYEFDGDTLKICGDDKKKTRPKDFVSKEGSELGLVVLKKAKP